MRNKVYNSNKSFIALRNKDQKEDLHKSGIYKLSFENSKGFYIGSTTESFTLRFIRHLNSLNNKNHYNTVLQKAYSKYNGKIILDILEICYPEECIAREQFYLDNLKPRYNICKIAGNTFGVKPSEKTLEKNSRKVDMFNKEGKFIKTFKSRSDAARQLNVCSASIYQAIRTKGSCVGFQFRNHGKFDNISKYEKSTSCKILLYSLTGEFIREYDSILSASKDLNIPTGNISKHLNNEVKKCYDFIFKKYRSNYPLKIKGYIQYNKLQKQVIIEDILTGRIEKFKSIRSVDPNIVSRSTLITEQRKNLNNFIVKKRYKIQIITHSTNDTM